MTLNYPQTWSATLKETVKHAYDTGRLLDIREALKQIQRLPLVDRGRTFSVGILRTFTIEPLLDHFRLSLNSIPCNPEIILGELENIEQELLDSNSNFLQSSPDLIAILWRLEELHPRLVWEIDSMSLKQRHDECNALIDRIQQVIEKYNGCAPLMLSTFFVPSNWSGQLYDQHRGYGVAEIVCKLNLFLYEQANAKKIRVFDFAQWLLVVGQGAIDNKIDIYARQPIAARYALSFTDTFSRLIRPAIVPVSKVLAVDLDNTLWGGILGEDGIENLKIGNDYPGVIYWRIQQLALGLKNRGILLVMLSKNDLEDVKEAFAFFNDMPLKLSDFSVVKVNWTEKYKNLLEVAKELNLGVDSFVLLDDQPFEQEQMQQFLPDVKVLRSTKDPLELLHVLSSAHYFDTFYIEHEDLIRSRDYEKQTERKKLEKKLGREEFLSSLEINAEIRPVTNETLPRTVQMLAKTNQFNLTSKRHSSSEVRTMLNNSDNILLTLSLKDRFGDQGIVGLCIAISTDNNKGEMVIDTLLMSCRALGRGAEDALWSVMLDYINNRKCTLLKACYVKSTKNKQVSNLFERLGMQIELVYNNGKKYLLKLPHHVNVPEWISVDCLEI